MLKSEIAIRKGNFFYSIGIYYYPILIICWTEQFWVFLTTSIQVLQAMIDINLVKTAHKHNCYATYKVENYHSNISVPRP